MCRLFSKKYERKRRKIWENIFCDPPSFNYYIKYYIIIYHFIISIFCSDFFYFKNIFLLITSWKSLQLLIANGRWVPIRWNLESTSIRTIRWVAIFICFCCHLHNSNFPQLLRSVCNIKIVGTQKKSMIFDILIYIYVTYMYAYLSCGERNICKKMPT